MKPAHRKIEAPRVTVDIVIFTIEEAKLKTLLINPRPINTTIGEMSIPPMEGIMRLTGSKTGSVILRRNTAAG